MVMRKKNKMYMVYSIKDIPGYNKGDIYAYTNDYDCIENFMAIRDMDKFYIKEVVLTISELNDLYKNHMDSILTTQHIMSNNVLNISLTNMETRECVNESYLYTGVNVYANAYYNPFVFKKRYIKALSKLEYIYAFLYTKNPDFVKNTTNRIIPNELNITIDVIKDTLLEKYKTEWT